MSNRKSKITNRKTYKKEKALLLLAFSFLREEFNMLGKAPKLDDVNNEYDLIVYQSWRWLNSTHKTFTNKKIKLFIDKRVDVVTNKYYNNVEKPIYEDLIAISMLCLYIFLMFNKHNNVSIFNPPIKEDKLIKFLNWYNEEQPISKEALLFIYRVALSIDPTKKSVVYLKSIYNKLYGNIKFEEIINE